MLANSLSLKIIRGTLLAFRDQLGFSASLLRSDNSFTMLLISHASIVFAPHPAFPLVYTCMVSMSGSTGYQCYGAWMDATYIVVIAMQGCQLPTPSHIENWWGREGRWRHNARLMTSFVKKYARKRSCWNCNIWPNWFTSHQSHCNCLYYNGIPEFVRKRSVLTVK